MPYLETHAHHLLMDMGPSFWWQECSSAVLPTEPIGRLPNAVLQMDVSEPVRKFGSYQQMLGAYLVVPAVELSYCGPRTTLSNKWTNELFMDL